MIDSKTVTVGTDAEIPLMLKTGELFPVTGLVGGTKNEPRPLGRLGAGFFIQEDNVNLEFNIPPASKVDQFQGYISKALRQIEKEIPPTMRLSGKSSGVYASVLLDNPDCQQFGCTPDFNVYTGAENPKPKAKDPNFRTAAAHVHIGWATPNDEDREKLVKMLDLFLAYGFIRIEDAARRELYGKAGSYRPKEYGIEYRVLGNSWIYGDFPQYVFAFVHKAIQEVNIGTTLSKAEEDLIVTAVNTGVASNGSARVAAAHGVYCV